jgi:hypothetical protein
LQSDNIVVAPLTSYSLTIKAGDPSATFDLNTRSVTVAQTVRIGASSGGGKPVFGTLTINPSVTLSPVISLPTSIIGGDSVQGTISLSAANTTDQTVSLTSSNAVAQAPSFVVVKAGNLVPAGFTVTTSPVNTPQTVVITATLGSEKATATLTVNPGGDAISSITLDDPIVTGGDTVFGTVTLAAPAPAAGVVVNLQSSNPAVALPPTAVTVTEPNTSARFGVSTYKVTSSTTVTITASTSGTGKAASLKVNPAGTVQLSGFSVVGSTIEFGGNPIQATLTFSDLTPQGGAVVKMTSTDSSTVPVSDVTVPAATKTWQVSLPTNPVNAPENVTITASYGGVSKSVTVTVQELSLLSVSVNPSSVPGGSDATGTVTLSGPAPAVGAVVQLSSSNPAAMVPSAVTVQAPNPLQTFTLTTSQVQANQTAIITATYAGLSVITTVTVVSPSPATLTVQRTGAGTGTVTSAPAGINCGGTCAAQFATGSQVTLTAAPDSGSVFAAWSGDCAAAGSSATATINLTADKACTATFNAAGPPVVILVNGSVESAYGANYYYPGCDIPYTQANWNVTQCVEFSQLLVSGSVSGASAQATHNGSFDWVAASIGAPYGETFSGDQGETISVYVLGPPATQFSVTYTVAETVKASKTSDSACGGWAPGEISASFSGLTSQSVTATNVGDSFEQDFNDTKTIKGLTTANSSAPAGYSLAWSYSESADLHQIDGCDTNYTAHAEFDSSISITASTGNAAEMAGQTADKKAIRKRPNMRE